MTDTTKPDELMKAINAKDVKAVKNLATKKSIKIEHLRAADIVHQEAPGGLARLFGEELKIFNHLLTKASDDVRKEFAKEFEQKAREQEDGRNFTERAKKTRRHVDSSNGTPHR